MALEGSLGVIMSANTLSGMAWEAQRVLTGMTAGQRAASIIKTGNLPVLLKSRIFAYTGDGVTVNLYSGPTYTGGTPDPVFNMSRISTNTLKAQLLTGFTLTADGVQAAATMSLVGPSGSQYKGSHMTHFGSNRLLAPNTSYLLTFTSISASQTVTARLEFLEGILDFNSIE